ncbi:MAG: hypothetical protein A2176_11660 [Spirochaetes bacterium RBG_13_51_14]|nr:MAG: hypothetical protein A2176_11660 [Spirochaetes bacterium RBG_13_51_14]
MMIAAIIGLISCAVPVQSEEQVQQQIKHTKEDVSQIVVETQNKLNGVKNSASAELVKYEISKIEEYIARSQKLLADGETDQAFQTISIAQLYFTMIDARIELQKALIELDNTKKNTSQ